MSVCLVWLAWLGQIQGFAFSHRSGTPAEGWMTGAASSRQSMASQRSAILWHHSCAMFESVAASHGATLVSMCKLESRTFYYSCSRRGNSHQGLLIFSSCIFLRQVALSRGNGCMQTLGELSTILCRTAQSEKMVGESWRSFSTLHNY